MLQRLAKAVKSRVEHTTGIGVSMPPSLIAAIDNPVQFDICAKYISSAEVDPRIIDAASSILAKRRLHRFSDSKIMLARGSASEKLCFYAASRTLAHQADRQRLKLLDAIADDANPLRDLRLDRNDCAMLVPTSNWPVLQHAVSEAKECFSEGTKHRADKKRFMATARLPGDPMRSKIMALATHPSVLRLVGRYLATLPILYRINLIKSENTTIEDNSSQFYHLDPEEFRQVKVFLLVSDVDDDAGPLHLLKGRASDEVQVRLGYRQRRLPDRTVSSIVGTERLLKCVGAAGTLAIGDTSRCFHFGSRPGKQPRYVVMMQYVSAFSEEFPIDAKMAGGKFSALAGPDEFSRCLFGAVR